MSKGNPVVQKAPAPSQSEQQPDRKADLVQKDAPSAAGATNTKKIEAERCCLHQPLALMCLLSCVIACLVARYIGRPKSAVDSSQAPLWDVLHKNTSIEEQMHKSKRKIVKLDPKPAYSITVPTARLIGPSISWSEGTNADRRRLWQIADVRPVTLAGGEQSLVSPTHGADKIGLFLYSNGMWDAPINVVLSRRSLCGSKTTISETLSEQVTGKYGCNPNCRIFLQSGWEVSSCSQLEQDDKLWLVQPGREYMHPTFERGHRLKVSHVETENHQPIILETVSESPKVFRLHNFFTANESDALINNALSFNDPYNRLHRSTTGQGAEAREDDYRTSENAWDMHSPLAIRLKRRIFELLGIRPFADTWSDGLQVLRYNLTKAYSTHHDYLDYQPGRRLDSAAGGHNRFATVLLYLSDVEEGGETVFPEGKALDGSNKSPAEALAELAALGFNVTDIGIKTGSWEERLVAQCRSRLATKPKKADAILFYDQWPDGKQDMNALHGGCPVISGIKWAANLWVWNGPVHGDDNLVVGQCDHSQEPAAMSMVAEFMSTEAGYSLFWQDHFYAALQPGEPVRMNTYEGHTFHVCTGNADHKGECRETWIMQASEDGSEQSYLFVG